MASPPLTPTHRRRPSSISIGSTHSTRSARLSLSRRSSAAYSPTHSRVGSSYGAGDNLAEELGESLADELGGWDEEDEDGDYTQDSLAHQSNGLTEQERDSGIDVASSPPAAPLKRIDTAASNGSLLSPAAAHTKKSRHHQRKASDYDGSEYGSESDLEVTSLVSASLEARLAAVEAMARRGIEENGSPTDTAVARFTEALRDLGGQMGLEQSATRLTTAYGAVATHLAHQSRVVAQLTSALLSPLAAPPDGQTVEEVVPCIEGALEAMREICPSGKAGGEIHGLASATRELVLSMSYLNDTLQVNRQSAMVAARRLRSVKDVLSEWKREDREREEGVGWIERGDWERRLRSRECARECRDVVEGFEKVCGGWRERLIAGAVG